MCNCGGKRSPATQAMMRQAPSPLPENMMVVEWAIQPRGMTRYLGPASGTFYNVYKKGAQVTIYKADHEALKAKGYVV